MGKIKTEKRAARKGLSEELMTNSSEVKQKHKPVREKTHRKDEEEQVYSYSSQKMFYRKINLYFKPLNYKNFHCLLEIIGHSVIQRSMDHSASRYPSWDPGH